MLGHMVVLYLVFCGVPIASFTVAAPVCIPTGSARRFPLLHILADACCLSIY